MAQTVLDILVKPNPSLDSDSITRGSNTFGSDWIRADSWRPWKDFTYENLLSIFRKPLLATWKNPPIIDQGSYFDHEIRDERSLDLFLGKFMWPIINGALGRADEVLKWNQLFYVALGSWCHGTGPPDWGLVSGSRTFEGKYWNLLPGDTKLSAKWQPKMEQSSDDSERYQWSLPVSQINTYAAQSECRYGFIITDQHLVVIRISTEFLGQGLASTRPSRQSSQPSHQRVASGDTDLSSVMDTMSLDDSFGAQSYIDNGNVEYQPPEYAAVKWTARGKGRLTVKLSLFCLCLMAGGGDAHISYGYPPLDSWRQEGSRRFVHNTSGLFVKKLPDHASVANPNVTGSGEDQPRGDEHGDEEDEDMDEGEGYEGQGYEGQGYEGQGYEGQGYEGHGYGGHEGESEGHGDGEDGDEGHQEEDEGSGDEGGQLAEGRDDGGDETAGPSGAGPSTSKGKRTIRTVEVKKKHGQFYFKDADDERRHTKKRDWTRVQGGWEYRGRKNTYFAETLPF
jgi:hypothetical protein